MVRRMSMLAPCANGSIAPGLDLDAAQPQGSDRGLGVGLFFGRHLLEVLAPQDFVARGGELGLEFDDARAGVHAGLVGGRRIHGFGQPALPGPLRGGRRRDANLLQKLVHEPFGHLRVAPEDLERLLVERLMLVALHEHRMQRPVEVLARGQGAGLNGVERIDHRARPDRQPGAAQQPGEMHDVFGQPARRRATLRWAGTGRFEVHVSNRLCLVMPESQ
jgi:hypothetical protein